MSGKMSRETKANEVIRKFEKNFATLKTEYERAQARVDLEETGLMLNFKTRSPCQFSTHN